MLNRLGFSGAGLVSALLLCVIASASVQAQVTTTFSGNIDGSEPLSFEVDNSSCTVVEPLDHFYETFPAFVTSSGTYTYSDLSILFDLDMQLTIYTNSYDPTSVLTNCVTRMDDSGTVTLQAGQQYIFVVQNLFDGSPSDPFATGDWEFTMTGPGPITQGSAPSAVSVPAVSIWSLAVLILLSLSLGSWVLLRR